ncbi:MAG: hypothetical protein M1510_10915 [Nitrospirae bacterium]|nr:hypothetical protein [Nitrospirota bacterium]MCL5237050.1 hypothetical protein [Nitrospirota bacterium]
MKITIEIENDEDIKKVERFIKNLKPSALQMKRSGRSAKIKKFLDFIRRHPIAVNKVVIPDREERNAR